MSWKVILVVWTIKASSNFSRPARKSHPSNFIPVFSWTWKKEPSNGSSRAHARYTHHKSCKVSEVHLQMHTCVNIFKEAQIHTCIHHRHTWAAPQESWSRPCSRVPLAQPGINSSHYTVCLIFFTVRRLFQKEPSSHTHPQYVGPFLGFMENLS